MLPPDLITTLNECAKANFVDERQVWLLRQSISSWLVIVGLVFEGPELLYELLSIVRTRIQRFRYRIVLRESRLENAKVVAFIGWIFIIGGLFGELRASSKLSDLGTSIQGCSDAKVREATIDSGDALKEIADLKSEGAENTDQLNKAYLQLGILKKRFAILGPRSQLLEDNKDAFIKALKPFAPQRIIVVSCGLPGAEGIEANRLGQDLMNLLGKNNGAGWVVESQDAKWEDCAEATANDPPVGGGVVLVLSVTQAAAKRSATVSAQKLEYTLNTLNITTRTAQETKVNTASMFSEPGSFWKSVNDDPKAIFLLVGPPL